MFKNCPSNVGQFDSLTNWYTVLNSPDYYNTCASYSASPNCSVPHNFLGYQYPASGAGYAGISTFIDGCCPEYREVMGAQLLTPLSINQKYYVKFQLSLTLDYNSNSGADKAGIRFSNVKRTPSNPPAINNMSDIYATAVITDTLNWTTIFGTFIADSAYSYIEIGNFFDNASTNIQVLRPQASNWSYYYFDDVCVSTDSLYTMQWTNGIKPLTPNHVNLYPNPSTGKVFFLTTVPLENSIISVVNLYGRQVEDAVWNKFEKSLLIPSNGIYFITVTSPLIKYVQKIVISN